MDQLSIYEHPKLYDRIAQPGPCEIFYGQLARAAGGPVLELACGTGRLTLPLARLGVKIIGLDRATAMLEQAKEKAALEHLTIDVREGDMRSFDVGELFSLIIVSCNSLAHLTSGEDVQSCLRCIRRHLGPGGLFAFDIVNPDLRILSRSEETCVRIDQGPNPSSSIAIEEVSSYDRVRQVRTLKWRVCEPGQASRELHPLTLRHFFPQEVPLQLASAGFELVHRYGDFICSSLTGDSLNQVCVAKLAEPTS